MNKFPCSLCGSRNWPDPDTGCPLCYEPKEKEEDIDDELTDETED